MQFVSCGLLCNLFSDCLPWSVGMSGNLVDFVASNGTFAQAFFFSIEIFRKFLNFHRLPEQYRLLTRRFVQDLRFIEPNNMIFLVARMLSLTSFVRYWSNSLADLAELFRNCLTNTYFQRNSEFDEQVYSVALGSPLNPVQLRQINVRKTGIGFG